MHELAESEYISLQIALMAHLSKTENTSRKSFRQICNEDLALGFQMLVIAF